MSIYLGIIFLLAHSIGRNPGGGGVHNMLRVQVCAAHMGGFLGPKSSKQGSLFSVDLSLNMGGLCRNWRKIVENG